LVVPSEAYRNVSRSTCGIGWTVRDILDTDFSWKWLAAWVFMPRAMETFRYRDFCNSRKLQLSKL
jgi:hypothetical protein